MQPFLRFTLTQRVLLNLLFILLIVAGAFAVLRSPVERYPNIHFGKVVIDTFYPGASPQDVEALITRKIEDALESLDDVEFIRSNSYRERSSVLVKFIDDTDYQAGYDELRFKVQGILQDLPPEIDPPEFNYIDVNDWFPAITVNIVGDRSNRALTMIGEDLKLRLADIDHLKEIKLVGEFTREFHLILDPEKLESLGITFNQAIDALSRDNTIIPAGDITTEGGEFMVRVDERFRSRDQVLQTIVRRDGDGSLLRIGDLAVDARLAYRDPFIISSVNGEDCISLQLIKTWRGSAIRIAAEVKKIVGENRHRYTQEGVRLIITQDSTVKIKDSIRVLGTNLVLGIFLVCLMIWSVMGFRNAALTTVGIPFAFMVTMVIMYLTGNSINELSLFSFVLVSGIIVDDAIVVVENIFRHIQSGKKLEEAVVAGTAEVFLPVVSATLTTISAFVPMLIMTGSIGEFFALIPISVSYALAASLIECLFILPVHYIDFGPRQAKKSRLGRRYRISCDSDSFEVEDKPFLAVCRRFFNKLLMLVLRTRVLSLCLVGVAFIIALWIFGVSISGKMNLIRITFFPDDYSLYYVEVEGPVGTTIDQTHDLIKEIAAEVMASGPGMAESTQGIAGFYINEDYTPVWGNHLGHVVVNLPSLKKRRFEDFPENDILAHLEDVGKKLQHFSEKGFTLRLRPEKDGPPEGKDINISILGAHVDSVQAVAVQIMDFLRNDPELTASISGLSDNQGQPGRVLSFTVDREQAAQYNLSPGSIAGLAASAVNGNVAGQYRLQDEEIDLKAKIGLGTTGKVEKVLELVMVEHPAGSVRLSDLVRPEFSVEPGFLNRFQRQRAITITGDILAGSTVSAQSVVERVRQFFQKIQDEYPGVSLNFSGEFESTKRSYTSLSYAFLIALLLIYSILATQFASYLQPLIIISAVIFALTGVIYGTFLSHTLFTINSFVAIVGVTGVVVNDSLVLIEFINKSYKAGLSRREAIVRGANIRLRPIILTTLTTTLGLLPMALGFPEYSLVWGTMAMTFVTGLCTATFLTIAIIPVEWDLLIGWQEKRERKKAGRKNDAEIIDQHPTKIFIEKLDPSRKT